MEEKRDYCVYKHTSKIDGRAYVGITRVEPEKRWLRGKGYKNNPYFWRYILKHSWDSLTHEILYKNLTEKEATLKERELIAKWDLTNKEKGFNLDMGGSTNNTFWKSVYCIETMTMYDGTRIAERETGISANHICYACNGKRDYAGKNTKGDKLHWVYGSEMHLIPKVIEKYRFEKEALNTKENDLFSAYKEKCMRKNTSWTREDLRKQVYKYDLQGNLVSVYLGLAEAAKDNNCNMTEIGQRCNGNGYTCGGYLWSYEPRSFTDEELLNAQNASNHQTILQYTYNMELVGEYPEGKGLYDNPQYVYHYIRNVCRRFKDSAYGYVWRFKGEAQEQFNADKEYYKNKEPSPKGNKIAQYTTDGQIIKIYEQLADVEKDGWGRNMVSLCCRGKKDIYRGYIWKYAE